jgi:hypothetical protein
MFVNIPWEISLSNGANLWGAGHADKREDFMLAATRLMQTFPDERARACRRFTASGSKETSWVFVRTRA